jgi:hypothetical protein
MAQPMINKANNIKLTMRAKAIRRDAVLFVREKKRMKWNAPQNSLPRGTLPER